MFKRNTNKFKAKIIKLEIQKTFSTINSVINDLKLYLEIVRIKIPVEVYNQFCFVQESKYKESYQQLKENGFKKFDRLLLKDNAYELTNRIKMSGR